jgi:trans-aconitate methyltransferase
MDDRPASDAWEREDPYEQYVGRSSRRVAPVFLAWLRVRAGRRWLDVGCGTGALVPRLRRRLRKTLNPGYASGLSPASNVGISSVTVG